MPSKTQSRASSSSSNTQEIDSVSVNTKTEISAIPIRFMNEFGIKKALRNSILECAHYLDEKPNGWSLKALEAKTLIAREASKNEFKLILKEMLTQEELTAQELFDINDLFTSEKFNKLDNNQDVTLNIDGTQNVVERLGLMDGGDDIKTDVKPAEQFISCNPQGIGKALAEARHKTGLTQEQVADNMGRLRQAVLRLERSDSSPTLNSLTSYTEAIGYEVTIVLKPK